MAFNIPATQPSPNLMLEQSSSPTRDGAYPDSVRPGGLWRANEPAGLTSLTELDFELPIDSTPNWNNYSSQGNTSIITDATDPYTSDQVGAFKYPSGAGGGVAFNNVGHNSIAANNAKRLYFCIGIKLSADFQYHTTGTNKLFFINVDGFSGSGDPFFLTYNTQQANPRIYAVLQGPLGRVMAANLGANPLYGKDDWIMVQGYLVMNSAGNADGEYHQWINVGTDATVKTHQYTDVEYVNSVYIWNNAPILQPTWGGGGDTVVNDFHLYWSSIYYSWGV